MLEKIRLLNKDIYINHIEDISFKKFGKILDSQMFKPYFKYLAEETLMPENDNLYIANDLKIDRISANNDVCFDVFGDMPLQYGFVNGHNTKLNALEYHKASEINIALTPLILMLGDVNDIHGKTFDSKLLTAYYVPANTVIEIYPRILHFSPCKLSKEGFKCGVILPYGTNTQFIKSKKYKTDEDYFLFKTNKWLLAHKEHQKMIQLGAFEGITGQNIEINY